MLDQFGAISQADQRPLEAMLQCGMPERDSGHCMPVEDADMRVHIFQEHNAQFQSVLIMSVRWFGAMLVHESGS
ncbi:hypothetical protein ASE28_24435 [Acidovorax sp. Root219]|nr:hypothetical protein ASE28_24435 [Acidovorax sp. Root219]